MASTDRGGEGRLGIYVDTPYEVVDTAQGARIRVDPADFAFMLFACEVGRRFASCTVIGRANPRPGTATDCLLPAGTRLVALPYYRNLRQLREVARAASGTLTGFWRGLGQFDTLWIFGPHPFAILFAAMALLRRRRVVLGVRQDTVAHYQGRVSGLRWKPVLSTVRGMDALFRFAARRLKATVVGLEFAQRYGYPRRPVLPMTVSAVRAAEMPSHPAEQDWSGRVGLLAVCRLDPDKDPLLLVETLARLEQARPGRYELTWAGFGRLQEEVAARAAALGVSEHLHLTGFVPFGADLFALYRQAHAFLHVSITEGLPQAIVEALAFGLPVVASDVGAVSEVLDGGRAGLLVPARDGDALVAAVLRLTDEPELRRTLATNGLRRAPGLSMEAQVERVATFLGCP